MQNDTSKFTRTTKRLRAINSRLNKQYEYNLEYKFNRPKNTTVKYDAPTWRLIQNNPDYNINNNTNIAL